MNLCLIGGGNKEPMAKQALDAAYSPDTPTKVLLVPSACSTQKSYDKKVPSHLALFKAMGVATEVLHDFGQSPVDLAQKFGEATVIFTIAGHSPSLMDNLKRHGTDRHYQEAADQGKMLAGTSAGALVPFRLSHINPTRLRTEELDFTMLPMLDLIPAAGAAHANVVDEGKTVNRLTDFANRFSATDLEYGLAMENNAGLLVVSGIARVTHSDETAGIHVLCKNDQENPVRLIADNTDMQSVFDAIMRQRDPIAGPVSPS